MDRYSVVFYRFQSYTTINTMRSYCSCENGKCVCGIGNNGILGSFEAVLARFYDEYLIWHHSGTAKLCTWLAEKMDLDALNRRTLIQSALVHDIGKLFIPQNILIKDGELSHEEMEIMKKHSSTGAKFLLNRGFPDDVVLTVKHHHEWFNGMGYPDGLNGTDIPLLSRILAVADTLDALISGRHYHKSKFDYAEIIQVLENGKNLQYDPEISETAIEFILKKENDECLKLG